MKKKTITLKGYAILHLGEYYKFTLDKFEASIYCFDPWASTNKFEIRNAVLKIEEKE